MLLLDFSSRVDTVSHAASALLWTGECQMRVSSSAGAVTMWSRLVNKQTLLDIKGFDILQILIVNAVIFIDNTVSDWKMNGKVIEMYLL